MMTSLISPPRFSPLPPPAFLLSGLLWRMIPPAGKANSVIHRFPWPLSFTTIYCVHPAPLFPFRAVGKLPDSELLRPCCGFVVSTAECLFLSSRFLRSFFVDSSSPHPMTFFNRRSVLVYGRLFVIFLLPFLSSAPTFTFTVIPGYNPEIFLDLLIALTHDPGVLVT